MVSEGPDLKYSVVNKLYSPFTQCLEDKTIS